MYTYLALLALLSLVLRGVIVRSRSNAGQISPCVESLFLDRLQSISQIKAVVDTYALSMFDARQKGAPFVSHRAGGCGCSAHGSSRCVATRVRTLENAGQAGTLRPRGRREARFDAASLIPASANHYRCIT